MIDNICNFLYNNVYKDGCYGSTKNILIKKKEYIDDSSFMK